MWFECPIWVLFLHDRVHFFVECLSRRELLDSYNFSMQLWANSRFELSSFISLWSVTSKSSVLLMDCRTLTSISVVWRSLASVDDVFLRSIGLDESCRGVSILDQLCCDRCMLSGLPVPPVFESCVWSAVYGLQHCLIERKVIKGRKKKVIDVTGRRSDKSHLLA